jgi:hypothetical protein
MVVMVMVVEEEAFPILRLLSGYGSSPRREAMAKQKGKKRKKRVKTTQALPDYMLRRGRGGGRVHGPLQWTVFPIHRNPVAMQIEASSCLRSPVPMKSVAFQLHPTLLMPVRAVFPSLLVMMQEFGARKSLLLGRMRMDRKRMLRSPPKRVSRLGKLHLL